MSIKVKRNEPCPCGTGLKHKYCCEGKVPWESILRRNDLTFIEYLSARGKNLYFIEKVSEILDLDKIAADQLNNEQFKQLFTPTVISSIYELIPITWPHLADLYRIYDEISQRSTSLFIGNYLPSSIARGVKRHSIYNEKILLVDPFMDPRLIRPEYNPILHPELHIENAIMAVRILFSMYEWIYNDIVYFIKTPGCFDPKLELSLINFEKEKFDKNPELLSVSEIPYELENDMKENVLLWQSDDNIRKTLLELNRDISEEKIKAILDEIDNKRKNHPFYVPILGEGGRKNRETLINFSTGANYEMAKLIATKTNSSLITDIRSRWKEIEFDHSKYGIKMGHWNSFTKAFNDLDFKFLGDVSLSYSLKLRKENRLENLRTFLSSLWRKNVVEDKFSEENIEVLKEELTHHIREAEYEWEKINHDLLSLIRTEVLGVGALAQNLIANGQAELLLGSSIIGGLTTYIFDKNKRHNFINKFPTSFFLDLKRKSN